MLPKITSGYYHSNFDVHDKIMVVWKMHMPKFHGENFANSHKTSKSVIIFSLKSFPLYMVACMTNRTISAKVLVKKTKV